MSRVEINAGGRHVIVDHDGELEPLRQAALGLWKETAGAHHPSEHQSVFGFTTETRYTPDAKPSSMEIPVEAPR